MCNTIVHIINISKGCIQPHETRVKCHSTHHISIEQYPTNKQYTAALLTPFNEEASIPNIIVSLTCSRRSVKLEKKAKQLLPAY